MKQAIGFAKIGVASLITAISVSAHAFFINNTPLNLTAANLGSQIVAPLVQPFSIYDLGGYLALQGSVTSRVFSNTNTGVMTFTYEITLTDGYDGWGMLEDFQVSLVPYSYILDTGYDTGGDAYTQAVDYSTVQIVEYRFDPWQPFMVGMTATVWLQTPIVAISSTGTGDLLAVGGNGIIDVYVPIVEPVTLGLLGLGLALGVGFRRRF